MILQCCNDTELWCCNNSYTLLCCICCHCFPLGLIEMTLTCVGILLLDFLHCIMGYISHDLHDTRLWGSFNRRFRYLRRDYMCSADTMISALQIPLQLKLLHPWNRGIHGYIRSFCVSLYSFGVPTFSLIHHLEDLSVPPQDFWHLWFGFRRKRFAVNTLINIGENRLANKYPYKLWMQLTSAATCLTLRERNAEPVQRLQVETLYRSIPNTTCLQPSE